MLGLRYKPAKQQSVCDEDVGAIALPSLHNQQKREAADEATKGLESQALERKHRYWRLRACGSQTNRPVACSTLRETITRKPLHLGSSVSRHPKMRNAPRDRPMGRRQAAKIALHPVYQIVVLSSALLSGTSIAPWICDNLGFALGPFQKSLRG